MGGTRPALVISELLLHDNGIDSQVLEQLATAADGWHHEASEADAQYWLYMLDHRTTGLQGLNSLQGRDNTVLELLKHMEGMGLLDVYLVNVERCENLRGRLGDDNLADFDDCEHAISSWMRLDGSNPCITEMKYMDIHGHVMQVEPCSRYECDCSQCVCFKSIARYASDPDREETLAIGDPKDGNLSIDRYWTRPALIFWPPSCRWKIRCQAGLQHCIDTLHHLNAEAANQPVLHASKHQANSEPSQQSAVLPEMAHVHTPAAQPGIRAEQDANNLANMMWIALEEEVLDPETMSALLSVLGLVSWENICKCVRAMALHMTQIILCDYEIVFQGFSALLVFQDGMQNIQEGSVHEITFHMALTLANLPVRAVKLGRDNLNVDTQQGIVLASVKAFTKCFAVPGSHQHIGLQDAYDDLVEMFIHRQEDFPVAEVLGPVCVQMTNPKDDLKLARSPALLKLMVHCMTELQQLTAHLPTWALKIACPARGCECPQLFQEIHAFLQDPDICMCQAETDHEGWRHLALWLYKHNEKVEFEVQETGADLVIITCIKTAKWHDLMVERYCPQCAWLAAITKATQQGILLLVLRQAQTRRPRC